jgi:hypothetical protein
MIRIRKPIPMGKPATQAKNINPATKAKNIEPATKASATKAKISNLPQRQTYRLLYTSYMMHAQIK